MTMKWKFSALALFTAVSFNTAAADSVNMTVKGTIEPGSCTPTLSSAEVDYSTINAASMTAVAPALNQLGSKEVTMTIDCTGASTIAIASQDARLASMLPLSAESFISGAGNTGTNVTANEQTYGLGTVGDVKIGAYTIAVKVDDVTATNAANNNISVDILSARSTSSAWSKAVNGFMNPLNGTGANLITFATTGTTTPVAVKTATIPLKITTAVQAMSQFPAGQSVTLDGNATIGIVYL